MADSDRTKPQTVSGDATQPESIENSSPNASRRHFVERTLGGMALSTFFARLAEAAQSSGRDCPVQCFDDNPAKPGGINCGLELKNPPQIERTSDAMLRGVIRVHAEDRSVPYWDTGKNRFDCQILKLRAYEGYQGHKLDPAKRVTTPGICAPGPTLRAQVGDTVQIALLNHIRPNGDFPETADDTCDSATGSDGKPLYPVTPNNGTDTYPNCFKASNTTNLHFHGTHVSPDCWGDNVLVQVRPNPNSTPEMCDPIFNICKDSSCPKDWKHDDPQRYKVYEQFKANAYSRLAVLQKNWKTDLVAADKMLEEYGEWPEYWPGYYPNCFTLPDFATGKYKMGQSPGTHWYHAHRHGSTTIHMLNGLSGAFIIEGDYDKKLKETMPHVQEKVMVIQQFQVQPNRERGGGSAPQVNVNGQLHPVIRMKPNEVQWWRLVNATVEANKINQFVFMGLAEYQKAVAAKTMPPPDQRGTCPAFRQTAQDGVQFAFENYEHPELQPPLQSKDNFALAPGNRADILVRAPTTLGNSVLAFGPRPPGKGGPTIVAHVVVESGASGYNTKWPEKREEYPTIPMFLDDINKWKNQPGDTKTLRFSMAGNGQPPLIDGEPFKEGYYNQTMELGDSEQWMIINESTAMHPFHIHVNPFQLVEIFDPVTMLEPKRLPGPWIWWDTMPLPSAGSYQNDKTKPVQSGHVRIRHNFVDFPGSFVLHCHILAHEDRGMMQLVRVVDNKTHIKHH